MLICRHDLFVYDKTLKLKEDLMDQIAVFFGNESATFDYFSKMQSVLRKHLLVDKFNPKFIQDDDIVDYVNTMSLIFCENKIDLSCKDVDDDFRNIVDIAFNYIKFLDMPENHEEIKSIKTAFDNMKSLHNQRNSEIRDYKYELDSAFETLKSNKFNSFTVIFFIKLVLFSDDYYNGKCYYNIRKMVKNSKNLIKFKEFFSEKLPEKDVFKLFFADYKILIPAIELINEFEEKTFKDKNEDDMIMLLFFLVYCRFIINMYSLVFQFKIVYALKNKKRMKCMM